MQRYGQFCPVAKAAEVFAERWTPLILRELLRGSSRFSDLQRGVPLMSRTLLAQRLKELDRAGVLERRRKKSGRGFEYRLTPAGEEFRPIVERLGAWGQRWARRQLESDGDYDTGLLMWAIRRGIHVDRLPEGRLVVFFEFRGVPRSARRGHRSWWLVLSKPEVDICLKDPGGEVDLKVEADLRTLTRAWLGDLPIAAALRSGEVRLEGARELVRAFPTWLALSPLASVPRPAGERRIR
ncbi:MAG: winged helix-turn-helix transcriptional regulator [Acidobacteriota bacterium]